MELLIVALASTGSAIILFLLTKLMGNRQITQFTMFDYVNSITIGSIAAEMATSLEADFMKPLLAMVIYTAFTMIFSYVTMKSQKAKRILSGRSLVLFEDGKLYRENLKRAKLDVNEFLIQCRNSGYFNLCDIQTAILEPNGRLSFLPISKKRPVTPEDMNLNPKQERPAVNVIIDGLVLEGNLKFTGNNHVWLNNNLNYQGFEVKDVCLATCDSNNNLTVYKKIDKPMTRDMFE